MKAKKTILLLYLCPFSLIFSQKINFEEYNLDNGLHVILHKDSKVPVLTTSIMYHVGSKDETPNRTGFAHFFEHLLFEGTENIGKGEWGRIVSSNGGSRNAETSDDTTYYYEHFPSNNLKLALWMESERMLHPIIDSIGVATQNEIVKEEKRLRVDNEPYGRFLENVKKNLFKAHPYRWTTIGKMKDLDAATLAEFMAFNKKYYVPNNAVLVVAGDIEIDKAKKMITAYFSDIPRGDEIKKDFPKEKPIESTIKAEAFDPNIQIPAIIIAYRTPAQTTKDSRVLNMISYYLSNGKTSRLYKKLVDEQKIAIEAGAFNLEREDYGMYVIYALPMADTTLDELLKEIEEEMAVLQTNLLSDKAYQKLLNQIESGFVNSNSSISQIARSLATYYLLYGNTNLINTEIDLYRDISKEDIKKVTNKYLKTNQKLELRYLPNSQKEN